MQIVQLYKKVKVMEKKENPTNTDHIGISQIDTLSFVKRFTGIISGIAIFLSICGLFFYYFIIRGNMIFVPKAYAGYFQLFDVFTIIWWLGAVIVISTIVGFLFAGIYNFIAQKWDKLSSQ